MSGSEFNPINFHKVACGALGEARLGPTLDQGVDFTAWVNFLQRSDDLGLLQQRLQPSDL